MDLLEGNVGPSVVEQLAAQDFDESITLPVQNESYSEISSLLPSADSSSVDELLVFTELENACIRSEPTVSLLKQRNFLTQSISEYEKHVKRMKHALKKLNAQFDREKALRARYRV